MRLTRGLPNGQNARLRCIHLICYAVQECPDRALNEVDLIVDPTQFFYTLINRPLTIFKTKIIGFQLLL